MVRGHVAIIHYWTITVPATEAQTAVDEVHRTLRILHEPGNVVEIRVAGISGRGKTALGNGLLRSMEAQSIVVWHVEISGEITPNLELMDSLYSGNFKTRSEENRAYSE